MDIVEQPGAGGQRAQVGVANAHLQALIDQSEDLRVQAVPIADLVRGQASGGARPGAGRRLIGGRDVKAGGLLNQIRRGGETDLTVVAEEVDSSVAECAAGANEVCSFEPGKVVGQV